MITHKFFVTFKLIGDYKISGRDSLVFLVDASKEMFIKGEDGEPSNFDMTMQVSLTVTSFVYSLSFVFTAFNSCAFLIDVILPCI